MNTKEHSQEQSKTRSLLVQAELALKEDRFEEAIAMLSGIKVEEFATLTMEELHAIGNLINYIKSLAEKKKEALVNQLKVIQASKEYL
ncbi:MAG: hypothetical protein N2647_00890 [Thermodesulfovibrio sp.]|nr:hypothetical protein [Thermodesulfovibrio sp.]